VKVREAMSEDVLTVEPDRTLVELAQRMDERAVGAAVVVDPEQPGPGLVSERDILRAVAAGHDLSSETARDHLASEATSAAPDWSLEEAAATMIRGNFRHLLVVDGSDLVGIISMRDVVHRWSDQT
jgi:CBS domain-containing protein